MAFPTPTIYLYRVRHVQDAKNAADAMYDAEFSINLGVTWFSLFPWTFDSLNEAMNEIANVVSAEAQFRTKIQKKQATFTNFYSYPPA